MTASSFVETLPFSEVLKYIDVAVSMRRPVCVHGNEGVGKTLLVHTAAHRHHKRLVVISISEQLDLNTLIGSHVCTDVPGDFAWKRGVLLAAIQEGDWLLLEDLHLASPEFMLLLSPLLEHGRLVLSSRNMTFKAHTGFFLFATATASNDYTVASHAWPHWLHAILAPPSSQELESIFTTTFPSLSSVASLLLSTCQQLQSKQKQESTPCRHYSTRDLFKLCRRVQLRIPSSIASPLSLSTREVLLQSFCEVFIAPLISLEKRMEYATLVAEQLSLPSAQYAQQYVKHYKPIISQTETMVQFNDNVKLDKYQRQKCQQQTMTFSWTRLSQRLSEMVAACISLQEPVLLVGETGTGKTTLVQQLAQTLCIPLHVINLHVSSEASDLLGGFKPVFAKHGQPDRLLEELLQLFGRTFSKKKNKLYLDALQQTIEHGDAESTKKILAQTCSMALKKLNDEDNLGELYHKWKVFQQEQLAKPSANTIATGNDAIEEQNKKRPPLFSFVDGILVEALRNGHWLLLDEVNLANTEVLECLDALLSGPDGSVVLYEKGDVVPIPRHPDFRLFACMNPSTDTNKKDLPPNIRHRFTEIFVDELSIYPNDLKEMVSDIVLLGPLKSHLLSSMTSLSTVEVDRLLHIVVHLIHSLFYKIKKAIEQHIIVDGAQRRPYLTLRTLTRALEMMGRYCSKGVPLFTACLEGFQAAFISQLEEGSSQPYVIKLFLDELREQAPQLLDQHYVPFDKIKTMIRASAREELVEGYPIEKNPDGICGVNTRQYILTPTVKRHLRCISRIVSGGTKYPILIEGPTSSGKTSLIEYLAGRLGYPILRINNHEHTDAQEYIGSFVYQESGEITFRYGTLVQALRHGCWLILDELNLAPSDVLEALNRLLDDNQELYIPETNETIQPHPHFRLFATQNPSEGVNKYAGRKQLSRAFRNRFMEIYFRELPKKEINQILRETCPHLAPSFCQRLADVYQRLTQYAHVSAENLLCGQHGFITLRDLFRWARRSDISTWSDLALHGYYLLAERIRTPNDQHFLRQILEDIFKVTLPTATQLYPQLPLFSSSSSKELIWTPSVERLYFLLQQCIKNREPVLLIGETGIGKTSIIEWMAQERAIPLHTVNCHMYTEASDFLGMQRPCRHQSASVTTFVWQDGPLIQAMKKGHFFLLDEISLADDAVLERLNSVLEPDQCITLGAEYNQENVIVKAQQPFHLFATMNPGGDFGKKELSPALRNRFVEIWVPAMSWSEDSKDLQLLVKGLLQKYDLPQTLSTLLIQFVCWFADHYANQMTVSIRDLEAWIQFITRTRRSLNSVAKGYVYGAKATFLDALGMYYSDHAEQANAARKECMGKLLQLMDYPQWQSEQEEMAQCSFGAFRLEDQWVWGRSPFYIPLAMPPAHDNCSDYIFNSPTIQENATRVLAAFIASDTRPILLEGSPGVGKTSLVQEMAKQCGRSIIRINLSDQTDLSDLFGLDVPNGQLFEWQDGPFLSALKRGDWILLDEINLACQSVLEGLNACFDHRHSVYLPDLDKTFTVNPACRIFATQNPSRQGGGRKGLPKSFVNRFSRVFLDPLNKQDLVHILCASNDYPELSEYYEPLVQLALLMAQKFAATDFNLRDIRRCLQVASGRNDRPLIALVEAIYQTYFTRLTQQEQTFVLDTIFTRVFPSMRDVFVNYIRYGRHLFSLPNDELMTTLPLPSQYATLVTLSIAIQHHFLTILSGPHGSGKTWMIQYLAERYKKTLHLIPLTNQSDAFDLLGCFERDDEIRGGGFKWVRGILIEAIQRGDWVLLENANECPAAVLDRLNSLFDTRPGILHVHEESISNTSCGATYQAHPAFHVFMTVATNGDRRHQLSRPMRNRGLEICIDAPSHPLWYELDACTLLVQAGADDKAELLFHTVLALLKGRHPPSLVPACRFLALLSHLMTQEDSAAVVDLIKIALKMVNHFAMPSEPMQIEEIVRDHLLWARTKSHSSFSDWYFKSHTDESCRYLAETFQFIEKEYCLPLSSPHAVRKSFVLAKLPKNLPWPQLIVEIIEVVPPFTWSLLYILSRYLTCPSRKFALHFVHEALLENIRASSVRKIDAAEEFAIIQPSTRFLCSHWYEFNLIEIATISPSSVASEAVPVSIPSIQDRSIMDVDLGGGRYVSDLVEAAKINFDKEFLFLLLFAEKQSLAWLLKAYSMQVEPGIVECKEKAFAVLSMVRQGFKDDGGIFLVEMLLARLSQERKCALDDHFFLVWIFSLIERGSSASLLSVSMDDVLPWLHHQLIAPLVNGPILSQMPHCLHQARKAVTLLSMFLEADASKEEEEDDVILDFLRQFAISLSERRLQLCFVDEGFSKVKAALALLCQKGQARNLSAMVDIFVYCFYPFDTCVDPMEQSAFVQAVNMEAAKHDHAQTKAFQVWKVVVEGLAFYPEQEQTEGVNAGYHHHMAETKTRRINAKQREHLLKELNEMIISRRQEKGTRCQYLHLLDIVLVPLLGLILNEQPPNFFLFNKNMTLKRMMKATDTAVWDSLLTDNAPSAALEQLWRACLSADAVTTWTEDMMDFLLYATLEHCQSRPNHASCYYYRSKISSPVMCASSVKRVLNKLLTERKVLLLERLSLLLSELLDYFINNVLVQNPEHAFVHDIILFISDQLLMKPFHDEDMSLSLLIDKCTTLDQLQRQELFVPFVQKANKWLFEWRQLCIETWSDSQMAFSVADRLFFCEFATTLAAHSRHELTSVMDRMLLGATLSEFHLRMTLLYWLSRKELLSLDRRQLYYYDWIILYYHYYYEPLSITLQREQLALKKSLEETLSLAKMKNASLENTEKMFQTAKKHRSFYQEKVIQLPITSWISSTMESANVKEWQQLSISMEIIPKYDMAVAFPISDNFYQKKTIEWIRLRDVAMQDCLAHLQEWMNGYLQALADEDQHARHRLFSSYLKELRHFHGLKVTKQIPVEHLDVQHTLSLLSSIPTLTFSDECIMIPSLHKLRKVVHTYYNEQTRVQNLLTSTFFNSIKVAFVDLMVPMRQLMAAENTQQQACASSALLFVQDVMILFKETKTDELGFMKLLQLFQTYTKCRASCKTGVEETSWQPIVSLLALKMQQHIIQLYTWLGQWLLCHMDMFTLMMKANKEQEACQPQEQQQGREQEESDDVQGMADGHHGSKNVSHEIECQEQIEGLKGDGDDDGDGGEHDDQQQQKEDDEGDAVDMQDDFDGSTHQGCSTDLEMENDDNEKDEFIKMSDGEQEEHKKNADMEDEEHSDEDSQEKDLQEQLGATSDFQPSTQLDPSVWEEEEEMGKGDDCEQEHEDDWQTDEESTMTEEFADGQCDQAEPQGQIDKEQNHEEGETDENDDPICQDDQLQEEECAMQEMDEHETGSADKNGNDGQEKPTDEAVDTNGGVENTIKSVVHKKDDAIDEDLDENSIDQEQHQEEESMGSKMKDLSEEEDVDNNDHHRYKRYDDDQENVLPETANQQTKYVLGPLKKKSKMEDDKEGLEQHEDDMLIDNDDLIPEDQESSCELEERTETLLAQETKVENILKMGLALEGRNEGINEGQEMVALSAITTTTTADYHCSEKWSELLMTTRPCALQLAEVLSKLIEPTRAGKLEGGYKTGKRLSMKKVIQYIASGYRKDKIWLRRTKLIKSEYQMMISVDASSSMTSFQADKLVHQMLAMLINLAKDQNGSLIRMGISAFGDSVRWVLTPEQMDHLDWKGCGHQIESGLTFTDASSHIISCLSLVSDMMTALNSGEKIHFILTDGVLFSNQEEKRKIQQMVRRNLVSFQIMTVFLLLDHRGSLMTMQQVSFDEQGKLCMQLYLDDFPSDYYVLVRDLFSLPSIIATCIARWMEMIHSKQGPLA